MELKPWYPRDFALALSNTFSDEEVTLFLKQPGSSPRFVYGILMLPTVLKYYLDADQGYRIDQAMTQATLFGYQLHRFTESSTPVIARSSDPTAVVEGMLIFDLDEHQRNAIYELESGLMCLASVQVDICQRGRHDRVHSLRKVDAGTFAWTGSMEGLVPLKSAAWNVDEFLQAPFYRYISESRSRSALKASESVGAMYQGVFMERRKGYTSSVVGEVSLYRIDEEPGSAW
ncbi:hypothetical protein NUU61_004400 [Penicillium alfredii]|uniref:Gamma-glutamylcyclotransferase AIG2-like domain-containing protein n=1 Tax=Penicillium alfredii TaxID=1506179 RepID=A0A9W9KDY7_9EURO|nr:uncharacterized protein NUU61_004400 [Penicillium alfredii]KAJ5102178.1 hypothetical protein NUU61_004400 [Penicillium alfredii]